jgi:hypothetical protein
MFAHRLGGTRFIFAGPQFALSNIVADFRVFSPRSCRPRVPQASVSATQSLIPSAAAAVVAPSTSSTRVRFPSFKSFGEKEARKPDRRVSFPFFPFVACSACGYPAAKIRSYNWGQKAKRRKTTGTGRMRYLKTVPRLAKSVSSVSFCFTLSVNYSHHCISLNRHGFRTGIAAPKPRPAATESS